MPDRDQWFLGWIRVHIEEPATQVVKLMRQRAHIVEATEVVPTNQVELKTRFGGYTFWEAEIDDGDVILKLRISLIINDSISVIAKEGDWIVKDASGKIQLVRERDFPAQFEPI